jgi:hypothetical protein
MVPGNPGRTRLITAIIGLYCLCGFGLIAQKPGLQYDEAMLVAGGVHMQHSAAAFELENTPNAWVCPFQHCIPLMAFLYVGSAKEYANLPFFAIFGGRAPIIRLVALMFGALAIWGVFRLIDPWFGCGAAALSALALAVNPAFLNMVIFDNGANGGFMAGLGLTCACVAIYTTRKSALAAFGLGAAMGFGVWSRANFIYFLVAGGVSALIVFRRRILIPVSHGVAIAAGGILGGFPFILYQIVSGGATWEAQKHFTVAEPMATLLRQRIFLFADTLVSDGEHRGMWNGPPLPAWQLWFFPSVVLLACLLCLFWSRHEETGRRSFAQFLTLTFIFAGGILFFSRLQVAEHHLVGLVPFALAIVVLGCSILQTRFRQAWLVSAVVLAVYGSSAVYWQIQSILGLRNSGGIGVWSNSGVELASYLDRNFNRREIKILDWGLQYNMYVLTDGRVQPREIYSTSSEDLSYGGRPWIDEIRDGGVFLLNGPENRHYPNATTGFLRTLAAAHPDVHRHSVKQQSGATYAEIIDITPQSIHESAPPADSPEPRIPMDTTQFDSQLTGFYPPEPGGFRWTKREFSARFNLSIPYATGSELQMRLYVPEDTIRKLGSLTLRATFGGHPLAPQTWSRPGLYVFTRELNDAWITKGENEIAFSVDKAMPAPASDKRELGLIVREISVEPE